jgi:hypothetical protein
MARRHRFCRAAAVLLLAGCAPMAPPEPDKPEEVTVAPASPSADVAVAPAPAPVAARPRPRSSSSQTAPGPPTAGGEILPSGQGSVTAEQQDDRDRLTVTAPPLNGVWRLEIPLEMSSDEHSGQSHDMTALYCRLYHDGDVLALRCAAAPPLSDPAETRVDGARIRFGWRFDGGTLTIDAAVRSLTELDGQVVVQPDKESTRPLSGPARLTRLDPASQSDGPNEALVRAAVEDLRQDRFDETRYAPGRRRTISDKPALTRKALAELGALETVTLLGEMPILNRDLDTGQRLAGFGGEKLAVRVYDLHFAEDSRLCSLLPNDAGQVYSFNCY